MAGFICFYYGNTGSTWLVETLSSSPRVFVPGFEPLEEWAWSAPDSEKLAWMRTALDPPSDTSSWDSISRWHASLQRSPQVVPDHFKLGFDLTGWKMGWGAISDIEGTLQVLASTGAKVISLTRSDRVRHAVSLYRYHEEGRSQFQVNGIRPPSSPSKTSLDKWLKESRRLHRNATALSRRFVAGIGPDNVFDVTYEEFVDDAGKTETISRLCSFLGLDEAGIRRSGFEKATPDNLASALGNFEELKNAYRFGRYRRFFSEESVR